MPINYIGNTDSFKIWKEKINGVLDKTGDLTLINLTDPDRASFVSAINKLIALIGSLSSLSTTSKSSLVSAINELVTDDTEVGEKLAEIGLLSSLNTTNKATLVAAINELVSFRTTASDKLLDIGDLSLLKTTNKDDLVSSVNEINSERTGSHEFTVGTKTTNTIKVTVQLKDFSGSNVAKKKLVKVYLSDDASGNTVTSTAPDGGFSIAVNGLIVDGSTKGASVVSNASGLFDINIVHTLTKTYYLVVLDSDGDSSVSPAIAF